MLYRIILGIHAYGMCAVLLMFATRELLLLPARKGWITPARAALRIGRIAGIVATVGILAGVVLFFLGRWPLAPWLVASLGLIAILMVVERRTQDAWQQRAKPVSDGVASSEAVKALACDTSALVGRLIVTTLFGLIVLLMAMKPRLGL